MIGSGRCQRVSEEVTMRPVVGPPPPRHSEERGRLALKKTGFRGLWG